MSGKPNNTWMETMVKKHGSREAVKEYMQSIGGMGGRNGNTGGFYANPELARIAGAKGGKAKVKKGYSALSPERQEEVKAKMAATRAANKAAKYKPIEDAMEYEQADDTDNQNHAGGVRKLWERAFRK